MFFFNLRQLLYDSKTYLLYTLALASLSTLPLCTRNLYHAQYSYLCMRSRSISIDTLRRIHESSRCNWTHVARQMDMWCFWGVLNAAILCWICLVWFPLVHLVFLWLVVTMFSACLIFIKTVIYTLVYVSRIRINYHGFYSLCFYISVLFQLIQHG